MSIYDIRASKLNDVYDLSGEKINAAFDVGGGKIFTGLAPISLDQVSEIFREETAAAMAYLNEMPDSYANYVVVTDTHYAANFGHSATIVNYLYGSGKVDKLVHLGDLINDTNVGSENWQYLVDAGLLYYGGNWLFAQGNHDAHLTPLADAMAYFEPPNVHYTINAMHNVYYYDSKKHGIRFLVLHHYMFANAEIRSEVENWIKYRPAGYKWAILQHSPFNNGTWEESVCVGGSAQEWLFGMIEENDDFIGNFSGHLHLDSLDEISSGTKTFHQMTFDTDGSGGRGDDANGQVVTIVSINPYAEHVKFYRIGRSEDLLVKQWEYKGFA